MQNQQNQKSWKNDTPSKNTQKSASESKIENSKPVDKSDRNSDAQRGSQQGGRF